MFGFKQDVYIKYERRWNGAVVTVIIDGNNLYERIPHSFMCGKVDEISITCWCLENERGG